MKKNKQNHSPNGNAQATAIIVAAFAPLLYLVTYAIIVLLME